MFRLVLGATVACLLAGCQGPGATGNPEAPGASDRDQPTTGPTLRTPATTIWDPHRLSDAQHAEYRQALSTALGSKRDRPCRSVFRQENGGALPAATMGDRKRLARQGLDAALVGGNACLWRAGVLVGDDGNRYDVYLSQWQDDAHAHAMSRVILERDGRLVGMYASAGDSFTLRGPELTFDHLAPSQPIHIGSAGPPPAVLIDGMVVHFEPAGASGVGANPTAPPR